MKALIIGGTGIISEAVSQEIVRNGWDLYVLNRGSHMDRMPDGAKFIRCDKDDEERFAASVGDIPFDVVADFIAYTPEDVERDIRRFRGRVRQFIFVSTTMVYQRPPAYYKITEGTPLSNPYSQYARDKIACERRLMDTYGAEGFPVTIVRPSQTYGRSRVPVNLQGRKGSWQVIDRILKGKPVIVHGDGSALWTATHSEDFARAFVGLMGNAQAIGESVHITSDESMTWDQFFDVIGSVLGKEVKKYHVTTDFLTCVRPDLANSLMGDKTNNVVFDNAKIKRLVPGFTASIRFEQGVRSSIERFLRDPVFQIPDPDFDRFCDQVIAAQEKALEFYQGLSAFRPPTEG